MSLAAAKEGYFKYGCLAYAVGSETMPFARQYQQLGIRESIKCSQRIFQRHNPVVVAMNDHYLPRIFLHHIVNVEAHGIFIIFLPYSSAHNVRRFQETAVGIFTQFAIVTYHIRRINKQHTGYILRSFSADIR